jgi:hypothetical protein
MAVPFGDELVPPTNDRPRIRHRRRRSLNETVFRASPQVYSNRPSSRLRLSGGSRRSLT